MNEKLVKTFNIHTKELLSNPNPEKYLDASEFYRYEKTIVIFYTRILNRQAKNYESWNKIQIRFE